MNHSSSHSELYHACRILFGTELQCSPEFLDYLQISGVKSAFRRRAMETHPDRLSANRHTTTAHDGSSFQLVRAAYENLLGFLRDKESYYARSSGEYDRFRPASSRDGGHSRPIRPIVLPEEVRSRTGFPTTEHYYVGDLPERVLLFGHFLYYSGLANWRTVARVLTWQRAERPRLGELGLRHGLLDHRDIAMILRRRRPPLPFGQTARNLGLLDEEQLQLLLVRQLRLHKKFGTILLEKKLLKDYELQELLQRFRGHNRSVASRRN
jgi:hypothetical protein